MTFLRKRCTLASVLAIFLLLGFAAPSVHAELYAELDQLLNYYAPGSNTGGNSWQPQPTPDNTDYSSQFQRPQEPMDAASAAAAPQLEPSAEPSTALQPPAGDPAPVAPPVLRPPIGATAASPPSLADDMHEQGPTLRPPMASGGEATPFQDSDSSAAPSSAPEETALYPAPTAPREVQPLAGNPAPSYSALHSTPLSPPLVQRPPLVPFNSTVGPRPPASPAFSQHQASEPAPPRTPLRSLSSPRPNLSPPLPVAKPAVASGFPPRAPDISLATSEQAPRTAPDYQRFQPAAGNIQRAPGFQSW